MAQGPSCRLPPGASVQSRKDVGFVPHLGFGELVVILLLALIIFGPGKLPEVGRAVGRALAEFKRASLDLSRELGGDTPTGAHNPGQRNGSTRGPGAGGSSGAGVRGMDGDRKSGDR